MGPFNSKVRGANFSMARLNNKWVGIIEKIAANCKMVGILQQNDGIIEK